MKAGLDKATFIAILEELRKMTRMEADHRDRLQRQKRRHNEEQERIRKESEERRAHRDARRISNG